MISGNINHNLLLTNIQEELPSSSAVRSPHGEVGMCLCDSPIAHLITHLCLSLQLVREIVIFNAFKALESSSFFLFH